MNIQIFGRAKCFDTKKAERYFKEHGVKYQSVDMGQKGMSRGEFNAVKQAVGGYEKMINSQGKDKEQLTLLRYLAEEDREEKLFENPGLIRTPIVRNGRKATIGYCPELWRDWE